MSTSDKVYARLADVRDPNSLARKARDRRWETFTAAFPDVAAMKVLDLGGMATDWPLSRVRPAHVTVVNLFDQPAPEPWMTCLAGDALAPPVDPASFDLIYSSSLIEHVGGPANRARLAEVIGQGSHYWVQTPYRYFPIEPHWVFPGMQFLPPAARVRISMSWPLTPRMVKPFGRDRTIEEVLNTDLLTATEMRFLFPDGTFCFERFAGLPKSMIAHR